MTKNKLAAAAILTALAAVAAIATFSYAAEPGSAGDPIALKSYVDAKISELEEKLSGKTPGQAATGAEQAGAQDSGSVSQRIGELEKAVAKLTEENEALRRSIRQTAASLGSLGDGAGGAVAKTDGDDVAGNGGADDGAVSGGSPAGPERFVAVEALADQRIILGAGTELVLRTGKALAIRGESGALVDLITGKDLDAGENVPVNHIILSPRDDNRGVRISEDAWVLIKGTYAFR